MFRLQLAVLVILVVSGVFLSLSAYGWQGADPTRPLVPGLAAAAIKNKGDIVLQSIIRKEQVHKAVINGEVVSKGDSVNEYRVVEINSSSVLLKSEENQLKLSLFSGVVFSSEALAGEAFSSEVK